MTEMKQKEHTEKLIDAELFLQFYKEHSTDLTSIKVQEKELTVFDIFKSFSAITMCAMLSKKSYRGKLQPTKKLDHASKRLISLNQYCINVYGRGFILNFLDRKNADLVVRTIQELIEIILYSPAEEGDH